MVWNPICVKIGYIQIEIQINVKVFFINFPLENQSMGVGEKSGSWEKKTVQWKAKNANL